MLSASPPDSLKSGFGRQHITSNFITSALNTVDQSRVKKLVRGTRDPVLSPALAGTRRACRAGEKSHLRVYTRDMFLQRFYGAQKTKIFLTLLVRHLYTRQLACEPQTGSLAYFLGTERKTTSSLDRSSTSSNIQAAAFAIPLCRAKIVLKVHDNLSKGASGSMKLN